VPVSPQIRIGTAGWSIPRQYGEHFRAEGSHLERYGRVLGCVEVNSSFYRPHRRSTWERWAGATPSGFRFAVKAPRAITHDAGLACGREALQAFLEEMTALGERLGPLLFQLPPSLRFELPFVETFLSLLRNYYGGPAVFEPRHESWFAPAPEALLASFRIARAAADPPIAPGTLTPAGWAGLTYYRLHGSPRRYYSAYSQEFLDALAHTLRQAAVESETWCIFDNTALGAAMGNALSLRDLLTMQTA
jgi:uncharacterized protein YecE (DUF72 family)